MISLSSEGKHESPVFVSHDADESKDFITHESVKPVLFEETRKEKHGSDYRGVGALRRTSRKQRNK